MSNVQLIRDVTGRTPLIQAQEKPVLLRPFRRREVCSLLGDESGWVLLLITGMENLSFPLCRVQPHHQPPESKPRRTQRANGLCGERKVKRTEDFVL